MTAEVDEAPGTTGRSSTLGGVRVALLESRFESELAALVRRMGGVPVSAPAVREAPLECDAAVGGLLNDLAAHRGEIIVFFTAAGCRLVFTTAERLGRLGELRSALSRSTLVCRGPKPAAALREHGFRPSLPVESPHTTTELLAALTSTEIEGRHVTIVAYGERNDAFTAALREHGAIPNVIQLYEWCLPQDVASLYAVIGEIVAGRVDAVAFTSQIQARHLFAAAEAIGQTASLRCALNTKTVVASIGPTCTTALVALGVTPQVTASPPKMRPMLSALAAHFERWAACC